VPAGVRALHVSITASSLADAAGDRWAARLVAVSASTPSSAPRAHRPRIISGEADVSGLLSAERADPRSAVKPRIELAYG
jgi:hypothetical protein